MSIWYAPGRATLTISSSPRQKYPGFADRIHQALVDIFGDAGKQVSRSLRAELQLTTTSLLTGTLGHTTQKTEAELEAPSLLVCVDHATLENICLLISSSHDQEAKGCRLLPRTLEQDSEDRLLPPRYAMFWIDDLVYEKGP